MNRNRILVTLGSAAVALTAALVFATPAQAQADKKTERTWKAKCASCHGMDGKAETEKGKKMKVASMATEEWQKEWTDEEIKKAINEGVKKEEGGVKKEMDPFKDELKPEQVDTLLAYIRGLKK